MPEFTIKLEGQEEFRVRISNYDRETMLDLEKIVKRNSTRIVKHAKKGAPFHTGNLRDSIRTKDVSKNLDLSYRLAKTIAARKIKGPHRHLVELGTVERITKSGASRGRMPANPFMARAEAAVAPMYIKEVRERILRKKEI